MSDNLLSDNLLSDNIPEDLDPNPAFVHCPVCHDQHTVPEVEFLGIEENMEGMD